MANIPEKATVTNQGSILKLACLAFFFFHSSISSSSTSFLPNVAISLSQYLLYRVMQKDPYTISSDRLSILPLIKTLTLK